MKQQKNLLIILIIILQTSNLSGNVIFVNEDVLNGNGDGTSWQNAYPNFQSAINEATYGDTIWVAQGTYKPTNGSIREIPFALKNGVKWFGGFQGNETDLNQRDFDLYPTILSGDIGVVGDSTDNSYHVVYTISSDSSTLIDGFFIQEGQAMFPNININSPFAFGGGMLVAGDFNNTVANPVIQNCIFRNNVGFFGAGLAIGVQNNSFSLNPFVTNCQFIENYAESYGGAILKAGGNPSDSPNVFSHCIFKNNAAKAGAGAVHLDLINEHHFEFCDFENNHVLSIPSGSGSAINIVQNFTVSIGVVAPLKIKSCNFKDNKVCSATFGCLSFAIFMEIIDYYGQEIFILEIEDSKFINEDVNSGTDIFLTKYYNSQILISDCIFQRPFVSNNSTSFNQALLLRIQNPSYIQTPTHSDINIVNSIFANYYEVIELANVEKENVNITMETRIDNCTFFNNKKNTIIRNDNFVSPNPNSYNRIHITNSIFWQDQLLEELFDDGNPDSTLQGFNIHHSLLKTPDCLINGIDMCGDGMLYNLYPEFRDTLNGDLSLRSCSPLLNQGDNAVIDSMGILFDIEGTPRIIDSAVDLGAYETQAFEVLFPQVDHVSCAEGMDGAMNWVQHGTPPYMFEWDNGTTIGSELSNLNAGSYNITITDADSCIGFLDLTVNEPLPLFVLDSISDATSTVLANGKIDLMPTGGIPDYEFLWSNGDTTASLENLLPGFYSVTITDANGCQLEMEYEVGLMTSVHSFWEKQRVELLPNISQQDIPVKLFFEISEATDLEINLRNELGQLFFSKKIKQDAGKSWSEIPSPSSSGLYFLEVKNEEGERKVLKWVVF